MKETGIASPARLRKAWFLERYSVVIFCAVTVLLTVAVILLPLPPQVGPVLVVFIPTLLAVALVAAEGGFKKVGPALFSGSNWRISFKWAAAGLGMALALRAGVSLLALVLGYPFQPQGFTPLLVIVFLFAAGEEIGWRGYALPRTLKRFSPLAAALLLGLPWAVLHVPLALPGRMLAGAPAGPLLLGMVALSVLTAWMYLGAGRSILGPVLLHGGQNFLVFLNNGIPVGPLNWLMAVVYVLAALAVIAATRGKIHESTG
jgi:membrane protease YdiL (CAAX protease family)